MGKMQAVMVSGLLLMPAGGLLSYVMIMMFLNHAGDAKVFLQVTAGLASLCGVTAALMPVAILLFMSGAGASTKKPAVVNKSAGSSSSGSGNNRSNFSDDVAGQMESEETLIHSADEFAEAASEDFETMDFDSSSMDEEAVDDFDNFDFEEEEEVKPKKKKKK